MSLFHSIGQDGTHIIEDNLNKKYLLLKGNNIEVTEKLPEKFNKADTSGLPSAITCLIGIIKLKINSYVILCDGYHISGSIMGHRIAKMESFKILALGDSGISRKDSEEVQYVNLLYQHLAHALLYFSLDGTYDLTNSLQRQLTSKVERDDRFWWNRYLCEDLILNGAETFVTSFIYGYFKSHSASFMGYQGLDFALFTRRATSRAGTRYFRRGIDEDGNVANFNETEQVLTMNNKIFSFLQIRGSVPVYWGEINNLKYKPNLVVSTKSSLDATSKHFLDEVNLYHEVYCVNLVNQKGYELPVKVAYEAAIDNLPEKLASKVKYIYFDFHHECRRMRWDRVRLLLDHLIKLGYTSDEYFGYDLEKKEVFSTQHKIVRTNCMDCLDRTNVVQSTLGRWVLQNQFIKIGAIASSNVKPWELLDPAFNIFFQNFWADNADAVSKAYSGTGALKTDFTRMGRRTKRGVVSDLINSITRYYKNNFADGSRQDAYDLFLGVYRPYQDSLTSPFVDRRPPHIQLLPYLTCTSILVMLAILLYPRGSITDWKNIILIGSCLIFNIKSLLYFNSNGYQFVNWPKLVPLDYIKKVDTFDGQGKFSGVKFEETDNFRTSGKKKN